MKRKQNKLNHKIFERARNTLISAFPKGIKLAFYVANFKNIEELPVGMRGAGTSGVCELEGENLNMRIYRESGKTNPRYDVDEIRSINREITLLPSKKEIENHHINEEIRDDIMARNQLTAEFVNNGKGELKLNVQPDGTVRTFINFENPTKELIKKC